MAAATHDELDCITDACAMYQTVLHEADRFGSDNDGWCNPDEELRARMPMMLAQLSPAARAMLNDHLDHLRELVAHVHRLEAAYVTDVNRSSA